MEIFIHVYFQINLTSFSKYFKNKDNTLSFNDFFAKVWSNRDDQYSQLRFISKLDKSKRNKVEMSYIGG